MGSFGSDLLSGRLDSLERQNFTFWKTWNYTFRTVRKAYFPRWCRELNSVKRKQLGWGAGGAGVAIKGWWEYLALWKKKLKNFEAKFCIDLRHTSFERMQQETQFLIFRCFHSVFSDNSKFSVTLRQFTGRQLRALRRRILSPSSRTRNFVSLLWDKIWSQRTPTSAIIRVRAKTLSNFLRRRLRKQTLPKRRRLFIT